MIQIGKRKGDLEVDPGSLVASCALVQGVRGSGKSYLVRVMVEQTIQSGLQTIIFDPEGEFLSLREKCDVVIAGPDGDVPCELRSAKLLARRVAQLGISTVIDMSRLSTDDEASYVADFLTTLDRLPKGLERPRLCVIDEAHKFAPESGKGRSRAREAVVLLMSQGRKRGLGAVLVTQRLSKLNKDAAAEAGNLFICRTSPIDLGRAQDLLGVTAAEREELRTLPDLWCFATTKRGVVKVQVREAQTTHPKPGDRYKITAPPPRAAVKKVLAELKDLPPSKEQEEAQSLATAQQRIRDLERELRKPTPTKAVSPVPKGISDEQCKKIVEAAVRKEREARMRQLRQLQRGIATIKKENDKMVAARDAIERALMDLDFDMESTPEVSVPAITSAPTRQQPQHSPQPRAVNGATGGGMRRIMLALACTGGATRVDTAIMAMLVPSAGTYATYLGRLKNQGLIAEKSTDAGKLLVLTAAGISELGRHEEIPTSGKPLIDAWRPEIGGGGMGRMFDALAEAGADGIGRADLARAAGLEASSGTFATYLGRLRKKGILNGRGWPLSLAEIFFR